VVDKAWCCSPENDMERMEEMARVGEHVKLNNSYGF